MKAKSSKRLEKACREAAATCMGMRVRHAARSLGARYDRALKPAGLKGTQFTLLNALYLLKETPLTEMAERLGLDRTTLTRNLHPLERDGLVKSVRGVDQRQRQLVLTARGRRALEKAMPFWRKAQADVRKTLGARLTTVADDLERLSAFEP